MAEWSLANPPAYPTNPTLSSQLSPSATSWMEDLLGPHLASCILSKLSSASSNYSF